MVQIPSQLLSDRAVIVTGGASGIGAATCQLLASHGAKVIVADIQDQEGRQIAADAGGLFVQHDTSDPASWARLLDAGKAAFGTIDGLVAAAGVKGNTTLRSDPDAADFNRTVSVNQLGILLGVQIIGEYMRSQAKGAIVNIASATGMPPAISKDIVYVSTKWAVRGISRVAARDLAPCGVRVNTILPGLVMTPMIAGSIDADAEQFARAKASIPMQRLAEPIEIAHAAAFLLSDMATYVTGAELVVDGGLVA